MEFSDTLQHRAHDQSTDWNALTVRTDRWQHGRWRLPIDAPDFRETGPMAWPTIVFPREAVSITQADREPLVADANTIVVYNAHTEYTREAISPRGDRCEWYCVRPDDALAIARDMGIDSDDPASLFSFSHTGCATHLYRDQRQLAAALAAAIDAGQDLDPMEIDEAILGVFQRALEPAQTATQRRAATTRAPTRETHRRLAEDARYVLAARFAERLTLDDLADELECSPFHLARVFRHWTGRTVHRYLTQLRLAAAMDLMEGGMPLAQVALRTGFCRHSHFTKAFHDHMGVTPSAWRRRDDLGARRGYAGA
ncbi:MAG: helix-turn-helix domain-containing protein [Phycisphaerales bacterium]